jgi:hypothetical protein
VLVQIIASGITRRMEVTDSGDVVPEGMDHVALQFLQVQVRKDSSFLRP